ncbi:hypothetical protein LXL04_013665 [Taraxacum kok-saghyz]
MDDGRVAVSNGTKPKLEFQESAVKSKLNRYVSIRDLESTKSGWNQDGIAIWNLRNRDGIGMESRSGIH